MASIEQNKTLLRRWYEEVFSRRNLTAVDEFQATNFVDHDASNPTHDIQGVKQVLTMYLAAFPNARVTAEDLIAEGDRVAARITMRGTHKGAFMDTPATGKQVTMTGIEILRFAGGKMVEHWGELDQLGMLQQLGVIPLPGQAAKR